MGNKPFTKMNKNQFSTTCGSEADQSFLPKFHSNKKPKEILMEEVNKLSKKISYVPYFWAETLLEYLNNTHPDQIYAQYQRVFYQNCKTDMIDEDIFLASRVRKTFLLYIPYQYNTKNCALSPEKLKQVFHEAKCYFMVLSWLQSIATLDNIRVKAYIDLQSFTIFKKQEKVYDFLIEITARTFTEYLAKKRRKSQDYYFNAEFQNCNVVKQLNRISLAKHFHERENQIIFLQKALSENEENLSQHLSWIQKMFGKSKIFGNLLLIREVGNISISYIWQKFYGDTYNDLLQ